MPMGSACESRSQSWVQLGCNKTSGGLLWALNQAIRTVIFQVITFEMVAVTAEVTGSGVPFRAIDFPKMELVRIGRGFGPVQSGELVKASSSFGRRPARGRSGPNRHPKVLKSRFPQTPICFSLVGV
jgi:hypothetical protein